LSGWRIDAVFAPENLLSMSHMPLSPTDELHVHPVVESVQSLSWLNSRRSSISPPVWRHRHINGQQQPRTPQRVHFGQHNINDSTSTSSTSVRIKLRPVSVRAVIWLACLYAVFYTAGAHLVRRADLILGHELFATLLGATHNKRLVSNLHHERQPSDLNPSNDDEDDDIEDTQDEDVETFALSEHLPGLDVPFITRLGNRCHAAPWSRSASRLPLSCQIELSDLLFAYHVALNKDRASVLRCIPPTDNTPMHSIVRANPAPLALTQYEKRVGALANLIDYEGRLACIGCFSPGSSLFQLVVVKELTRLDLSDKKKRSYNLSWSLRIIAGILRCNLLIDQERYEAT
jgi:hypothetical protein